MTGMVPADSLAVLLFMALGVSPGLFTTSECDFTSINLEDAVKNVMTKLPRYIHFGDPDFTPTFPGFETAGVNITGLDRIDRYGPLIPYCLRGHRMLQLDLISTGDVKLNVPWRFCHGPEGSVSLRASLFRFTVQLGIERHSVAEEEVKFANVGPMVPVYVSDVHLFVNGFGKIDGVVNEVLGKFIPPHMFSDLVLPYINHALQRALE